jgi:CBS domain-containing protein
VSCHKIRHLPVVGRDGRLAGVVTDRDLRHHLFKPEVFHDVGAVSVEALLRRAPVASTETDVLRRIVGADACCTDVECIVVSYP